MRLREIRTFLSELARMLRSGLPIREALDSLSESREQSISELGVRLGARLGDGETLASALSNEADAFPVEYIGVIEAGERAGKLPSKADR